MQAALVIFLIMLGACKSKENVKPGKEVGNIFDLEKKEEKKRRTLLKKTLKNYKPKYYYTITGKKISGCPRKRIMNKKKSCPPGLLSESQIKFITECRSGETSILIRCDCKTYLCSENTNQTLR